MIIATPEQLGDAVRRARKTLRLTQAELADLAGCGVVFVVQLEGGKATVQLDKVLAVLVVLDLQLSLSPATSLPDELGTPSAEQPS